MIEQYKGKLKKLTELSKEEVLTNERNVIYHFIIPLLDCFGHNGLDFEHPAQGNRIDIFIGDKSSCGFVIEAKSYDKNLDDYLEKLKIYSDAKRPLLAIISNGEEIRFYSYFWKRANFSDTLLYSIKRIDLNNDEIIGRLEKIFSKENLDKELLHDYIDEREKEIQAVNKEIELKTKEYKNKEEELSNEIKNLDDKINDIKTQISEKKKEILDLKNDNKEDIIKIKLKYLIPIIVKRIVQSPFIINGEREKITFPYQSVEGAKPKNYGFELKGQKYPADSSIDVLKKVMEELSSNDPDFLIRFASREHGTKRRYIAETPDELYPGKGKEFTDRHKYQLKSGRWLGTNYGPPAIENIIKMACEVAGISYGHDLIVHLGN